MASVTDKEYDIKKDFETVKRLVFDATEKCIDIKYKQGKHIPLDGAVICTVEIELAYYLTDSCLDLAREENKG